MTLANPNSYFLQVPCPKCGAEKHEPCREPSGFWGKPYLLTRHWAREREARAHGYKALVVPQIPNAPKPKPPKEERRGRSNGKHEPGWVSGNCKSGHCTQCSSLSCSHDCHGLCGGPK